MTERESSKKDFLSEAEELLEELTNDLQHLEKSVQSGNIPPQLINKLFREFHSLKGISGMLGFDHVSNFTHELENMLDHLRLGKLQLKESTVDLLFQSIDMIHRMLSAIKEGSGETVDASHIVSRIGKLMTAETAEPSASQTFAELDLDEQTLRSLTEYEEHRLREAQRQNKPIYSIRLVFSARTFDVDLRRIYERLSSSGEIISTLPYFDATAPPDTMLFRLIFSSIEPLESIRDALQSSNFEITDLQKTQETKLSPVSTADKSETDITPADDTLRSISNTVRVDIEKLDDVINVIGELVISKAMISSLSRELLASGAEDYGLALSRAAADLEKKLNDLQHRVIETRLVPVGQMYHRLARIARKISRETDKTVQIQFSGEDTALDKIMIEQISDPLMHVVRNAIDHGIESPEERRRIGKPEKGLIQVSAFQRGNHVVIQIQDDGRGINVSTIQENARRRGMIANDRVLNRAESLEMIFTPGFSSTDQVTELSGRGVGLDVVKRNIAELKGTVTVFTEENRGTMFEITLPITLAIIQALIVRIGRNKYAVPLSSVSETVRIYQGDIQSVDQKEVYYLRDKTISLILVDRFFGFATTEDREKMFMIVVPVGDQLFGLVVDELAAQQEIIIKSMGEKLKNVPGIAGAAEIGEQRPILVLDPESMIEEVTHGTLQKFARRTT